MKDYRSIDTYGNVFNCVHGIVTLKLGSDLEAKEIAEYNESGHLIIGRNNPLTQKINGCWAIYEPLVSNIADDNYVVLNTIDGVLAAKKEVIKQHGHKQINKRKIRIYVMQEGLFEKSQLKPRKGNVNYTEVKPYIDKDNNLVVPENVADRYRWWEGDVKNKMGIREILMELRAAWKVAEKYLHAQEREEWIKIYG